MFKSFSLSYLYGIWHLFPYGGTEIAEYVAWCSLVSCDVSWFAYQSVLKDLQTNKMEEAVADSSPQVLRESSADKENVSSFEPPCKKLKISDAHTDIKVRLEDRLSGILCCAVCLDLPKTCYQVRERMMWQWSSSFPWQLTLAFKSPFVSCYFVLFLWRRHLVVLHSIHLCIPIKN